MSIIIGLDRGAFPIKRSFLEMNHPRMLHVPEQEQLSTLRRLLLARDAALIWRSLSPKQAEELVFWGECTRKAIESAVEAHLYAEFKKIRTEEGNLGTFNTTIYSLH
jgi:hypothetical protein